VGGSMSDWSTNPTTVGSSGSLGRNIFRRPETLPAFCCPASTSNSVLDKIVFLLNKWELTVQKFQAAE
jgi:hypothetical protein